MGVILLAMLYWTQQQKTFTKNNKKHGNGCYNPSQRCFILKILEQEYISKVEVKLVYVCAGLMFSLKPTRGLQSSWQHHECWPKALKLFP